jgi:hypothetical protein
MGMASALVRRGVVLAVVAAVALGLAAPPASAAGSAASAASAGKRPPVASAGITPALPSPRLDQDTSTVVTIRGANSASPISVEWGDSARSRVRVACSVVAATRRPDACTATLTHRYARAGSFAVAVRDGRRVIARTWLTVRPELLPWSPPAGWIQPAGWSVLGSATYVPCSTVPWFYDRATEPASGSTMHADVAAGLAMLAERTGLTLTETADPALARLTISWGDVDAKYPGASGYGGFAGGNGYVVISQTDWWPTDAWPGFGIVTQLDGRYSVGRGWLVVHEAMHALGLGHVGDVSAIMNPIAGATSFSPGDLDGLNTMYPHTPCPA